MKPCEHFDGGVCYSKGWGEPFGEGCLLNHKNSCPHYSACKSIKVKYKNWKDEIGIRTIVPNNIFFGRTDYHHEDQWLMDVWDIDKQASRIYAMMDIIEFIKED